MNLTNKTANQWAGIAIGIFLAMLAISIPSMAQVLRAQVRIRGMD